MPDYYPSKGDAVGAAMAHNIRLAHGSQPSASDAPLPARFVPRPSDDPYSVPDEVACILEEANSALVGAFTQLTELVAAAADWARVRLDFDDPHRHNLPFEAWKRLAAAQVYLQDAEEQVKIAEDLVAECPADLTDPRHHKMVNVLRTRELLHDVLGTEPAADSSPPPAEEHRRGAATGSSPNTTPAPASPPLTDTLAPTSQAAPAARRSR